LIIDNYDSFTYNLYHYVSSFGESVRVIKNDMISFDTLVKYDKIIISPGPGLPYEHKNIHNIVKQFASSKSILGVCLGHQAIAESFGAKLKNLDQVLHGVSSDIILIKEDSLFNNIPNNIRVGHYHSWVIDQETLPDCFYITSKSNNGDIMSICHQSYDLKGLQFHPESVLTKYGLLMIRNWIYS